MTAVLVERSAELAAAAQARRASRAGRGSLVVIAGGPGAGRSALLDGIADQPVAGEVVLRASGSLLERGYDFGVMRQLVQPLLAASPGDARRSFGEAIELGPLLSADDGQWDQLSWPTVLTSLTAIVANVSQEAPLVLIIDDLQWADSCTLQWLDHLGRQLDHLPITVFCAIADGVAVSEPALLHEIKSASGAMLYPAPLSVTAVHRLARAVFDGDGDEEFAAVVHRVTAANPAAVDITLRGLSDAGLSPNESTAGSVEQKCHLLLRDRRMYCLSIQPPLVQAMARAMAVLGSVHSDGAGEQDRSSNVSALTDADPLDRATAVRSLGRLGFLSGSGTMEFVHPSIPDAVLSVIPVEEREELHRRAAALLHAAGFPAGAVAQQLLTITSGYAPWETDVLRAAAAAALDRGASRVAASLLRPVLFEAAPGATQRGRLLVEVAVAERGFDLNAAVRHITQALLVLPSVSERATAALWIPPGLAADTPAVAEALRLGDEVLRSDGDGGPHQDLALRLEARMRYVDDQRPAALQEAAERLAQADVDALLTLDGGRELLTVLLHSAGLGATRPAAEVAALAARLLAQQPPQAQTAYTVLPALVPLLAAADAPGSADRWVLALLEQTKQADSAEALAVATAARGMLLAARGRLSEAQVLAGTALDLVRSAEAAWPDVTAMAASTLTTVVLATHDLELCERITQIAQVTADLQTTTAARMARGVQDLVRGELPAAVERFLDCGQHLAQVGWSSTGTYPWRLCAADVLARLGRTAQAGELADQEYQAALAWGAPAPIGRALSLLAALAEPGAEVALRRQAVEVLNESADLLARSRAAMALGRCLEQVASPEAHDVLLEGSRLAAECGVGWTDGREDARTAPGSSLASTTGDSLTGLSLRLITPEEVELTRSEGIVIERVREGWTNQRIADSLSVSRRAIEKTLTGAYRKFGVHGRNELVTVLNLRSERIDRGARSR